jgi:hypothetical protein
MLLEVNHVPVGLEVGRGVNIRFDLGDGKSYVMNMKVISVKSGEGNSVIECECDNAMLSSYCAPSFSIGSVSTSIATGIGDPSVPALIPSVTLPKIPPGAIHSAFEASPALKRRGRPKGSKNKPKAPKEAPE